MKILAQTLAILTVLGLGTAGTAHARECEGVTLRNAVQVDGTQLSLNGMGVREATVFNVNVYVAGLYVESTSRDAAAILNSDTRKQLILHFVRDVDRDDITDAMTEGFRSNAAGQFAALQQRVNQLNGMLTAMDDGDEMTFTYVPGTGLQVKIGSRVRGTIEGADFARAFFSIWLGSHPPNRGLKTGLLGGACG